MRVSRLLGQKRHPARRRQSTLAVATTPTNQETSRGIFDLEIWIRIHSESEYGFSKKVHSINESESEFMLESRFTCELRRDVGDKC